MPTNERLGTYHHERRAPVEQPGQPGQPGQLGETDPKRHPDQPGFGGSLTLNRHVRPGRPCNLISICSRDAILFVHRGYTKPESMRLHLLLSDALARKS